MPSKKEVFTSLQVLKKRRSEMVQDFLEHAPEIYEPSYKYENNPKLLELSRDKYFLAWMSNHWNFFMRTIDEEFHTQEQGQAKMIFADVFLGLLNTCTMLVGTNNSQISIGLALVEDMQSVLVSFINAGENTDMLRNKLSVAMEKNRVVFERHIKQLESQI